MNIKVVFFASLRETLGEASLDLEITQGAKVSDVLAELSQRGENWQLALQDDKLLCALDHTMVEQDTQLEDGQELAFFPPVTGG